VDITTCGLEGFEAAIRADAACAESPLTDIDLFYKELLKLAEEEAEKKVCLALALALALALRWISVYGDSHVYTEMDMCIPRQPEDVKSQHTITYHHLPSHNTQNMTAERSYTRRAMTHNIPTRNT